MHFIRWKHTTQTVHRSGSIDKFLGLMKLPFCWWLWFSYWLCSYWRVGKTIKEHGGLNCSGMPKHTLVRPKDEFSVLWNNFCWDRITWVEWCRLLLENIDVKLFMDYEIGYVWNGVRWGRGVETSGGCWINQPKTFIDQLLLHKLPVFNYCSVGKLDCFNFLPDNKWG
mgnify:CR=1 FL=1